ncbi:MAG: hypothetical protein BalsKO_07350 [Balneolaceae bacterium]
MSKKSFVNSHLDYSAYTDPSDFETRDGPPQELPALIGMISMHFQQLEDYLSLTIIELAGLEFDLGEIITAELSFRTKVHIFSSLFKKVNGQFQFNSSPRFQGTFFNELIKALFKCEEIRNQTLHSTFVKNWENDFLVRMKITAKAKTGLRKTSEITDITKLYNQSDYILVVLCEISDFFGGFRKKV